MKHSQHFLLDIVDIGTFKICRGTRQEKHDSKAASNGHCRRTNYAQRFVPSFIQIHFHESWQWRQQWDLDMLTLYVPRWRHLSLIFLANGPFSIKTINIKLGLTDIFEILFSSKISFWSSNFTKLPFDLDKTGKGHLRNSFKRSQEVCVWGWWRHSVVLIYSRHERTKTLSDQSQLIKYKSRNGRKRVSTVRSCKTDLGTWLRK